MGLCYSFNRLPCFKKPYKIWIYNRGLTIQLSIFLLKKIVLSIETQYRNVSLSSTFFSKISITDSTFGYLETSKNDFIFAVVLCL